jgi:hypothetical protein
MPPPVLSNPITEDALRPKLRILVAGPGQEALERSTRLLIDSDELCCDPRSFLQMKLEFGPGEGPDYEAIEV